MTRRRFPVLFSCFAALALLAAACGTDKKAASSKRTTTIASTTTTTSTSTTIPPAPVSFAPLTGAPIDAATAAKLARPALAVKIDNSQDAMPQEGLNDADVVFEIKVEGISRLMAVFHSADASEIGPTRSARFSDPPILALLGRPLFGWSGANDGVVREVYRSSWIYNVNWDRVKTTDYYRKSGRAAPHNLFTTTQALWAYAKAEQGAAQPLFQYLTPGQSNSAAAPLSGVSLSIGDTPSAWVWNAATSQWLRWQYGRRDQTVAHGQANAQNVVILEIHYNGGSKTPTADTLGTGRVLVLTNGTMITGVWSRPDQLHEFTITGTDGQPIKLTPGRTWVELTPGTTMQPLSGDAAAALMAGG